MTHNTINPNPAAILEAYTKAGCTFGRCTNTKYIQVVRVSIQNHHGNITFLYRGSRRGAFEEVRRQFPGYLDTVTNHNYIALYYTPGQNAELCATTEELEAEPLTRAAIAWHIRETLFPVLPLALPAAGTPDHPDHPDHSHHSDQSHPSEPSDKSDKSDHSDRKPFSWDNIPEEEQHPQPEHYTNIKKIAEESNTEYIEVYRTAADIAAELLKREPESWHDIQPGMFLNLDDCGLKMDGADNIGGAIETMTYGDEYTRPRLCMVEKVIETTDEDLQLFPYNDALPEGCALGGSCCDDEERANHFRQLMSGQYTAPATREAAEKKYYGYWFTLVTMIKSPNYCVFIDAEGYTWSRYILFLPTWRTMYAAEIQAAQDRQRRQQEEEAADQLVKEAAALLQYTADCDRLRPYMVADLSQFDIDDRQGRQNGRRRNILAALRHFFPGQKFSVKYRWASYDEIEISWTDGPTSQEVENCCNWSIFCDNWYNFDAMTDSSTRGTRNNTTFAQAYGGGRLCGIRFDRDYSTARTEAANDAARDILTACGISPATGAHCSGDSYTAAWNAVNKRYGRAAADWLNGWSHIDTYAVARAIMATNADRPTA